MGSQNFVKILAIETSCDETAIALMEARGGFRNPQFRIIKNAVSSQIKIHRPFGGVVPSLAKREHIKNLPIVLKQALDGSDTKEIDLIAVTVGPGLEPALWTGINFAKELAVKHKKPLTGVNHLAGHMYSFLLPQKKTAISNFQFPISKVYPAIVLIVSGGHTILIHQKDLTTWKKIGETRDDAAGEAFDKVARLLGLPYPGGPELEKLTLSGNPSAIEFPRPMIYQKNYDFSFSGLKTAVLYYLRDHPKIKKKDVAASFQQAIIDVLIQKTIRAAHEHPAHSIILSGGVASNKALQKRLRAECRKNKLDFLSAERKYQTDNAAMIAVAAYISHLRGRKSRITAQANLNL
ncbi:MAG: tRNA (adenosine(37)-N6)-threonylcarbamoyltransferase complex transferase subunit TsaD [bacterium]|nr:tRNA (adenosine(37)-N6)-threonylcarbamoyltransferase complex transferase subunit TsaD [bacterium]